MKAVYKEAEEESEPAYFVNQRRQWQPRQSGMFSDPSSSFQPPQFNTQQQNMWQNQSQPPFSNWSPQMFPTLNPWMSQFGWQNFPYPPPYWQNNSYPPQWTPSTSQSSSWQTSWPRSTYQPAGSIPLPQPTLPALQQNPQSNLRLQLPAQPNPNPNNRPVQSIQIIDTSEIESDLRECNDLQLRSGRIIETEGDKTIDIEIQLPLEQPPQREDENKEQNNKQASTSSPPFPERLVISRPIQPPDFDILGELQNLYIKIPFLQAIQDIPIYAKTIKELCIKKSRRNTNTNPRVQVVGTLSDLLSGKETPIKYEDPGNPIVTVQIYGQTLTNALVDLGAAINILTTPTCQKLGIMSVEPTSTLLELADRSVVRPEGTLNDVMVSVDSWEYPTDFLVINPKTRIDKHPLILGRPWLATADAYIGCR